MNRASPEADRFIADLEGLLHAAREAAAAALLSEVPTHAGGKGRPPLVLYSCSAAFRDESLRIVVQLLGRQALYEGVAERAEWVESPIRVAARATLAALTEWDPRLVLGVGDVVETETKQGTAAVVTVIVREGSGPGGERTLVGSAWLGTDPAAAGARAVLQAFALWESPDSLPGSSPAL